MENIPINTVLMAVKAIDRDEGCNGYIQYHLSSELPVPFSLGSVNGLLGVSGPLHREIRASYLLRCSSPRYTLTVRAEDCAADVGGTATGETRFDTAKSTE